MASGMGAQNYFLFFTFLIPTIGLIYLVFSNLMQINKSISKQRKLVRSELNEDLKDPVTGLPNREASKKYFDTHKENQTRSLAIVILDIDNFRMINDTLGYSKGDEVLKRFAVYLKNKCKSEMHIARLGGDEFIIIARDLNHAEASEFACEISDYIKSKDSSITVLDDSKSREYTNLTLSVGISCFPDDGDNYHALVKHADSAMMNVKRQGKNGIKRYHLSEESHLQYQQILSRDLARALDKGQFSLNYQPIYHTQTLLLTKAEALLRWTHPVYGSVPPSDFIEIAERTGNIYQIGLWVIRQAISDLSPYSHLKICVNVSVVQLSNSSFVKDVEYLLDFYRFPPERLEFEITETLEMYQNDKIPGVLSTLSLLGISIYIDDFGTGYSNFAQLLSMNIRGIKIDKGLINLINAQYNNGNHIIKSIVDICDATGFTITAEGIERADQYELIKEWKCHFSQGYLLAKPMPYKLFSDCISEIHVIKAI